MNNEIKEILDILQNCKNYDDEVFLIKQHSATLLYDYIINLQKTNKNHSKKLIELGNKITNLQQEKDNLYLDNTMLKMEKDIYKQGYEDFKELIEKTITEVNNE